MKTSSQIVRCSSLNESYIRTVLPNGLRVLCCERPERVGVYAVLAAGAGSISRSCILDDKKLSFPAGTAHFLEHKLFAGKNGDAFELFSKTGAAANAFTSLERTCYVFGANDNAEQALKILLEFVSSPYFTDKNVQKEKSIIGQEISMYEDNPDSKLFNGILRLLYHRHPARDDIAGSIQSINEITKDTLFTAYNAFYAPSNMVLAVSGRITNSRLLEICGECMPEDSARPSPVFADEEEPETVFCNFDEKTASIGSSQFCLGFKEKPVTANRLKTEIMCDVLSELIAGESTDFYNELYDSGLINGSFFSESVICKGLFCNTFGGESSDPDEVRRRILGRIDDMRKNGIDPERLNEVLRASFGDAVLDFENNTDIASAMALSELKGYGAYDALSVIQKLTANDLEQMLCDTFCEQRSALFILKPNERD